MSTSPLLPAEVAGFQLTGELPRGVTVLEASAGTGKTYTIASLAARFVAEGHARLSELLLITFSRAATRELRDRVRNRLVELELGLAEHLAGRPTESGDDEVYRLLASGDLPTVTLRHDRLRSALTNFDAATIATTHEFAGQMRSWLGIIGDTDPGAELVEDISELTAEVVDDFYLRKFAPLGAPAPPRGFTLGRAAWLAQQVIGDPAATLLPTDAEPDTEAAMRLSFSEAVRAEVDRRKRLRQVYAYDDILCRLRDVLIDPARGPIAVRRLAERFRVVLIDEFQDTDLVQWQIVHNAFVQGEVTTVVLIGDPKQAIYAFRGADVASYLAAARTAGSRATLTVNHRTDAPLLAGLDAVFGNAALGDPQIVVPPVRAAHPAARISGVEAALCVRVVDRTKAGELTAEGLARVGGVRPFIQTDLVNHVIDVLEEASILTGGPGGAERSVEPGDIAVLVRTNDGAVDVQRALLAAGVPAVVGGTASVFSTGPAAEWLTFLRALEQPHRQQRARLAALTQFIGWTATELATADTDKITGLIVSVRRWRRVLAERGVAALLESVTLRTGLTERVLRIQQGERTLTDLRHVAEVLHRAALHGDLRVSALIEWLRERIEDADSENQVERSRRLETDSSAVQVLTVHRSKGLEFPIVLLPSVWDARYEQRDEICRGHQVAADGHEQRTLFVAGPTDPGYEQARLAARAAEVAEGLREFYVAATRAKSHLVVWWAATVNTRDAPLQRLLFGHRGPGAEPVAVPLPTEAEAMARLAELTELAAANGGSLAAQLVAAAPPARRWWAGRGRPQTPSLDCARFTRELDLFWRRTSYSGLTAAVHDAVPHDPAGQPMLSEPEGGRDPDEPDGDRDDPGRAGGGGTSALTGADPAAAEVGLRATSPMADLPSGAAFGVLVHGVYEYLDTTAADLGGELRRHLKAQTGWRAIPRLRDLDADALVAALLPALHTPLGPLASERRLADIGAADRLAELEFELPLAGGVTPGAEVLVSQIADLLEQHLGEHDPLREYPDALRVAGLGDQQLRGYLTGSIDSVLRLGGPAGAGTGRTERYLVVDYKTNWLGPFAGDTPSPLLLGHYTPDRMAAAMIGSHYPLQALLYSVALHRYLRWRRRGYDPTSHLGGVLYLFLRGMAGEQTPRVGGLPCGVFSWQPGAELVGELSDLLAGASPTQPRKDAS